jgi:hypothetical protein
MDVPARRGLYFLLFVSGGTLQEAVDNDDGSCFYRTHDNFLVYGSQGMKNDFGGTVVGLFWESG